jgi:hypothetical protein
LIAWDFLQPSNADCPLSLLRRVLILRGTWRTKPKFEKRLSQMINKEVADGSSFRCDLTVSHIPNALHNAKSLSPIFRCRSGARVFLSLTRADVAILAIVVPVAMVAFANVHKPVSRPGSTLSCLGSLNCFFRVL